jgi:hypothetical protein
VTTEDDLRKQAEEQRRNIPSAEHRGHIRRFQGLTDMTDMEDVALRGYVIWKWLEHNLQSLAAVQKARTKRSRRD